jgi:lipid II:glycine glycyltransferase (peptidoglycan interpeptide bridge formation enzyme)
MEENKWRALWEKCSGSVYQSWEWAELNRRSGRSPIFIAVEDGKELKSGILCFEINAKTMFGSKKILFSEGSPLARSTAGFSEVLQKFKGESKNYFYGFIRPAFFNSSESAFAENGFYKSKSHTISVSLSQDIDGLFKNLEKKSARWGVKKAEKEGVRVEEGHLAGEIKDFYEIYKKTAEEQFNPEPVDFFENISILERQKLAKLLLAKHNGSLIGGALLLIDSNYGVVSLTAVNDEGMKLQAMNLLYWEMIKQCKKENKKLIDLGGYAESAREGSKMGNINRFKENFGGSIVEQPVFSTSKKYALLSGIVKKFQFLKKLYKKEK